MRALLIGNAGDLDPGFVGRSLRRRGWHFCERVREDHASWPARDGRPDLEGASLVVSLGSGWSTYWDHVADAVVAERELMATAIAAGAGVLGVCFGAQQLATVLGGEVTRADTCEIGWHDVRPLPETVGDAPVAGTWMQWHYDRFTVPSGVTALADSDVGPQAFVAGRSMGVQFHPEADESIVTEWSSGTGRDELASAGIDHGSLMEETRRRVDDAAERCDRLVDWFLARVHSRAVG